MVDAFEPGSTFKTVTAALALERGVVTPDSPVDCHMGSATFFGRTVRDHGTDHMGVVPFSTVLAQSSNVGTVEVALKLGPKVMYEGMTRFGFGQSTGVDLPGRSRGHGAAPGQMVSRLHGRHPLRPGAELQPAAGGRDLRGRGQRRAPGDPPRGEGGGLALGRAGALAPLVQSRKVLGEGVRLQLVKILKGVVDEGTGVAIALPGYTIAGKTGTAQKFNQATGHYSMQASWSTFVGFAPAENPAFVAAVMLDEPQGMTLGGWTAGPVFRTVLSSALTSYGVAPDEGVASEQQASANAQSKADALDAWTAMYKRGARPPRP